MLLHYVFMSTCRGTVLGDEVLREEQYLKEALHRDIQRSIPTGVLQLRQALPHNLSGSKRTNRYMVLVSVACLCTFSLFHTS